MEDYENWKKMWRKRSCSLDLGTALKSKSLLWNLMIDKIIKEDFPNRIHVNSEIDNFVEKLGEQRMTQRRMFSYSTSCPVGPPTGCPENVSNSIVFNQKDTIFLLKCLAINSIMFHLKSIWLAYSFFFGYKGAPYLGVFYYLSFKGFLLQSSIYGIQIFSYLYLVR